MQVDQRCSAAGVAYAFHQLAKVGACVGGELVASVAQVMKMNVKSGRGACLSESIFGTHPCARSPLPILRA
jgi:hypothetical protein